MTFWRDSQGNEIDLIVKNGPNYKAYEIKSGDTFNTSFFSNLNKWGQLSNTPIENLNVIYGGKNSLITSNGNLISLHEFF